MVDHEDQTGDTADQDPFESAGPRRSTFTPPSAADGGSSGTLSEDEVADLLAEDLQRAMRHTGSIRIHEGPDAPAETDAPEADTPGPEPGPSDLEPPEPEGLVPDAADAVPPPPARQSLPTDVLAERLTAVASEPGNTLEAMDRLEQELRLRQEEAAAFSEWERSALARGTPDAVAAVEDARADFADVLDEESSTPLPSASAEPAEAPSSHVFRQDEASESELLNAPPPMSASLVDIPPPPGHEDAIEPPMAATPVGEAPPSEWPPIPQEPVLHDLVEPRRPDPAPLDFESLLHEEDPVGEAGQETVPASDESGGYLLQQDPGPDPDPDPDEEDVDEIDRVLGDLAGPFPVTAEGVAVLPGAEAPTAAPAPPVEPILSPRAASGEVVPAVSRSSAPPAFAVEESALEPTPLDQRVGRAARLFWLWFAANASIVSVAFGGVVLSLGMSLRQAIVATLAGVAISFFPLGLGTLAGKWSGQPTMVVSRASFGHVGNILPAVLALLTRLFWGAILLWFLAAGAARILVGAELGGGLTETQLTIIGLAAGFVLALVIAFLGYGLLARVQLVLSVVSAILVAGLVVVTWPAVDIQNALTIGDGPWIVVLSGAVLVFSFVGLVWAVSSADLARYQRPASSGASSMLWSTFGATVPAFILIAYGAVLAASNPAIASGLLETPLDTIALLIPIWYPVPLIAALALSLLSGVVITIYSGGFALQAIGVSLRRSASVVVVGVALAVAAILLALVVGDFAAMLRDVATSLAVPVAAWVGIFGAEMMIRNRPFDTGSLLGRGNTYPAVRWVNLGSLVIASAIGFGFTTASAGWLAWQGYLFEVLGVPAGGDLAASDLGVLVALALGLLTPIVAGIPAIRRQERSAATMGTGTTGTTATGTTTTDTAPTRTGPTTPDPN